MLNVKVFTVDLNRKESLYRRAINYLSASFYDSYIYNKLRLPTPKELGKSGGIGLPSRTFSPYTEEYTWEDYEQDMRKSYPIRYWLFETLPLWFHLTFVRHISDAYWWFIFHFIRREHLLDLRQPLNRANKYPYRYGYIDVPERMLYANFNCLVRYMEEEHPERDFDGLTPEELRSPNWKAQYDSYKEAETLYFYWIVARHDREKYCLDLYNRARELTNRNEYDVAMKIWMDEYDRSEDLEDEMLMRLIRIRKTLWT